MVEELRRKGSAPNLDRMSYVLIFAVAESAKSFSRVNDFIARGG